MSLVFDGTGPTRRLEITQREFPDPAIAVAWVLTQIKTLNLTTDVTVHVIAVTRRIANKETQTYTARLSAEVPDDKTLGT